MPNRLQECPGTTFTHDVPGGAKTHRRPTASLLAWTVQQSGRTSMPPVARPSRKKISSVRSGLLEKSAQSHLTMDSVDAQHFLPPPPHSTGKHGFGPNPCRSEFSSSTGENPNQNKEFSRASGFAWDLLATAKTALRASWGVLWRAEPCSPRSAASQPIGVQQQAFDAWLALVGPRQPTVERRSIQNLSAKCTEPGPERTGGQQGL